MTLQSPEAAQKAQDLIQSAIGPDPTEKMAVKAIDEEVAKSGSAPPDGGKNTEHGQQRADEARTGDTHRQVGDANKVVQGGKQYTDTDTGNTVHVSGNRVVITNAKGEKVTQFKNTRANTQQRVKDGKWQPK